MTETIYKPRCLREFKEKIENEHDFRAKMTMRWNDLTSEAKQRLTLGIKTNSRSWTIRHHEKATIEAINQVFTEINPIIEQTKHQWGIYEPSWSFGSGMISSAGWLNILSTIIVLSLRLRRLNKERFLDYFMGIGGQGSYSIAREYYEKTIRELSLDSDNPNIIEPPEVSLTEVTNASNIAIRNRTNH